MIYLLDASICLAAIKLEPAAVHRLDALPAGSVALPAIVVAELAYGACKSRNSARSLAALAVLTAQLPTIDFDLAAAHHYGHIRAVLRREGTPIGPNDFLIAATALALRATLVTRNVREFARVPGLQWITF